MTFISYAKNFEDVLVWRALRTVGSGFYVDYDAGHPDRDSATRALYNRGWRGVNVTHLESTARLLREARPRDVTIDADRTDAVWPGNPDGPVHVMRIGDRDPRVTLLASGFMRLRPWILIVAGDGSSGWEDLVTGAGYRQVWFDGCNRFYVSDEKLDELAPHFRLPPNAADAFMPADDTAWAVRVGQAEALAAAATIRAQAAEERADRLALVLARHAAMTAELDRQYRERTAERHDLARHVHTVTERALGLQDDNKRLTGQAAETAADRDRIAQERDRMQQQEPRWRLGRLRVGWEPDPAVPRSRTPTVPAASVVPPIPDAIAGQRVPEPRVGREIMSVHQYHPDSSTGDAITASMLVIQGILRRSGFRSHIYVDNRDPALRDRLLLLDDLPHHSDYIMLLHHSMGQRMLDRILALPVTKVLMYHNITPPRHLASASLREAARLGRTQLEQLRDQVAVSLADSEFNALELRRLGFAPVRTCPLLFDVSTFAGPAVRTGGVFTVLFVGRITESKGQLELVESFALFTRQHGPARLVLVGRDGGPGDPYGAAVRACIRRHGLAAQVEVTGAVPDARRDALYGEADLYVSLSVHEGFGVPLVEAMARGVPVLARPAGAVAETLGGAGVLLDRCEPTLVAAQMLRLARDPARLAAMRAAGLRAVERFGLERNVPVLLEALVRAGAALQPEPGARAALLSGMRFAVAGPLAGAADRQLALGLDAARPGRVRVLPDADLDGLPEPDRAALVRLAAVEAPDSGPEVCISHAVPPRRPADGGDLTLALVPDGGPVLDPGAVSALAGFDGVLAPSRAAAKALLDAGVAAPIRLWRRMPALDGLLALGHDRAPAGRTMFLHAGGATVAAVLAAYGLAFDRDDAVELVIASDTKATARLVDRFGGEHPRNPAVRTVPCDAWTALLATADAAVLPDGDGIAQALAARVPLIALRHGGAMDLVGDDEARLVDWTYAAPQDPAGSAFGIGIEPAVDDLAAALRAVAADPAAARTRAERGRLRVLQAADPDATAGALETIAADLLLAPPARPVRVAWVSTWAIQCGIAEYSRQLLTHLGLGPVTVLADRRPFETDPSTVPGVSVWQTWQAGRDCDPDVLLQKLLVADADAVCIQHQPGLIPWTVLARILEQAAGRWPTVVVLHTTRHLSVIDEDDRAVAVAGLRLAARVLVHTVADLNALRRLGLVENVALLPHGVQLARPPREFVARTEAEPVLIGSFGFLLPDKGIPQLIKALHLLRQRWPAARLRLVCALYSTAHVSAVELLACRAAIAEAGLEACVELVTDYLPLERSLDLLAACDLVVMPYQFSLEASSAALRVAMASGVPVAVTPLPIFDEAGDAVARLAGVAPDQIAAGMDRLLQDVEARTALVEAAGSWIGARSWDVVGRRLGGMLTRLASPS